MATKTQTSNQSQNHIKIAEDLGTGSKQTLWVRAIAGFKKPFTDADQRDLQAEEERLTQDNDGRQRALLLLSLCPATVYCFHVGLN